MAFVRTSPDRTWVAEDGLRSCPQVVQMAAADGSYVMMDFADVLDQDTIISSVVVAETASQTITIADESVSNDGRAVSFKLSGMSAGDYTMRVTATLSSGTTQTVSKDGALHVVA